MPFKSERQRAWLHIHEPEIADRWEKHTPNMTEVFKIKEIGVMGQEIEAGPKDLKSAGQTAVAKMHGATRMSNQQVGDAAIEYGKELKNNPQGSQLVDPNTGMMIPGQSSPADKKLGQSRAKQAGGAMGIQGQTGAELTNIFKSKP